MSENSIRIDIDTPRIDPQREKDQPLMDKLMQDLRLTKQELQAINKCRLYLKVFNVSELVTGDGKRITMNAWEGKMDHVDRKHTIDWPQWERPHNGMWYHWRDALRRSLCARTEMVLDELLGRWYGLPNDWTWFLYEGNLLSCTGTNCFLLHEKESIENRRQTYKVEGLRCKLPAGIQLLPTTVSEQNCALRAEGVAKVIDSINNSEGNDQEYHKWLYYDTIHKLDKETVASLIDNHHIEAVTDGNYVPEHRIGTAAWTNMTDKYDDIVTKRTVVPGSRETQSSYRSKLCGMLVIMNYTHEICQEFGIDNCSLTIYCDNERTVMNVNDWISNKVTPSLQNADLISTILKLRDAMTISITCQHILGHQDDDTDYDKLTPEAQKNVDMDLLAKELATKLLQTNQSLTDAIIHLQ